MDKRIEKWTVEKLSTWYSRISFPEYQREPTIWSLAAKQRLIDSMFRRFDIASIYFYENDDGSLECIDGRQRIGAIMSFLDQNEDDREHNGFVFKSFNEIYDDDPPPFSELERKNLLQLRDELAPANARVQTLVDDFNNYEMTIVMLSGSSRPEEFNLQFTRLNLGTIINSGEKLHAMVGEMRNACFDDVGRHAFLERVRIPTRRFAKEQVAAQILAQACAIKRKGEFARTRHFDLQLFFKENSVLDGVAKTCVDEIRATLDALAMGFVDLGVLRNRAITVSTVLHAWQIRLRVAEAGDYAVFITEFQCRLNWQLSKGLGIDDEYRYLLDFQRHVTQASVEKPAVQARAGTLDHEYSAWRAEKALVGDREYAARVGSEPSVDCRAGR